MQKPTHPSLFLLGGIAMMVGILMIGTYTFAANGDVNVRGGSSNDRYTVTTQLTGAQEVPSVSTSMHGHMTLHITSDEQTLRYNLHAEGNRTPITAAHLHCAPRGQNGPVVVPLVFTSGATMATGTTYTSTSTAGMATITLTDIATSGMNCNPNIGTMSHLVQAIREGKIYANVHTGEFPNGEIRGQLELPTFTPESNLYHNGNTFVFDSADLRISEIKNATTTNVMQTRTFLVTISNSFLDRFLTIWTVLTRMFPNR